MIETVNPTTEEVIFQYSASTTDSVKQVIKLSSQAHLIWKSKSFDERAACFKTLAEELRKNKRVFAELITQEMGKPVLQAGAEIEKCAWVCEYYADHAGEMLLPQGIEAGHKKSFIQYDPLGVVFSIMPWNFPFWQVFRFAAPAMMAGNTVILKHAAITTRCAMEIERLFMDCDFVDNAFRSIVIENEQAETLISDPTIQAVTITGSTQGGKAVAEICGRHMKKCVMELGGSDPYIILDDCNLDNAVKKCVESRMINNGQSCVAAKRFIVLSSIKEKFEQKVLAEMQKYKMGDPLNPDFTYGPLARLDLKENLFRQVIESQDQGATTLWQDETQIEQGFYFPATVLTDVTPGMPAFDEELFGPVVAIIEAQDEDDAIYLANETKYGLGAGVFSEDRERAERIAQKLNAGSVFINGFVKSDPRLPFGGIKESGFGRELSDFGIKEFVNVKTVVVD